MQRNARGKNNSRVYVNITASRRLYPQESYVMANKERKLKKMPLRLHEVYFKLNQSVPFLLLQEPKHIQKTQLFKQYRDADKSLAWPTSWWILFDDENISFDASLVIYIYIYIVLIFLQLWL